MKKYKITFQEKHKLHTKIIATSDISKEKLPLNVIKIEELSESWFEYKKSVKLNKEEVSHFFFELNIILKAKIPIYDALEILENGTKNTLLKEIISKMKEALQNGQVIYKVLKPYEKYLGNIVISFFKIAEENGNLEDSIYSLSILLKDMNENKKLISQKLRYPMVLLLSLVFSLYSIFNFVIPQFEFIFEQYHTRLPFATIALLAIKDFLMDYFVYMMSFFGILSFYIWKKYTESLEFRYKIDKFIVTKIPFIGPIVFLIYFHRFFLSLKILLEANYKFQSCLINSSILLKNKYLLDRISQINKAIQNGVSIFEAFSKSTLFNDLTLRLISTGEKSNALLLSVNEIEKIYKQKLDEKIKLFSSLIEPLFIFTIMLFIVWVILAVLVPLWSMGEVINV
ncbi:MAG: type II secretion system F family protein [Campylobacteraceae bacterium]|nr:type II secretion system F family protein [Campylobacteraceae bacterium]